MQQLDADHGQKRVVRSLHVVDEVVITVDQTENVSETLAIIRPSTFTKGGTASPDEIAVCVRLGICVRSNIGSQLHLQDPLASMR